MTTAVRTHKLNSATKSLVAEAHKVLIRLHPMSLRGLHYQMVSRGVYSNTPSNYAKLGRAMTKARESGLIQWNWIVDNMRQTDKPSSWADLEEYIVTVRDSYRKRFWARLPVHIEVFVEKDAMAATLSPVTREYDIALHPIRGYISTSYCWMVASQWRRIRKPVYCFYLGDWDPRGLDIERDLRDKLQRYSGRSLANDEDEGLGTPKFSTMPCFFSWQRLGVVQQDFDDFDLLPIRVKRGDKLAKAFMAEYGDKCAELDAVPPDELRSRVDNAIQQHIDQEEWARLQRIEQAEQETFTNYIDQFPKVKLDSLSDGDQE